MWFWGILVKFILVLNVKKIKTYDELLVCGNASDQFFHIFIYTYNYFFVNYIVTTYIIKLLFEFTEKYIKYELQFFFLLLNNSNVLLTLHKN